MDTTVSNVFRWKAIAVAAAQRPSDGSPVAGTLKAGKAGIFGSIFSGSAFASKVSILAFRWKSPGQIWGLNPGLMRSCATSDQDEVTFAQHDHESTTYEETGGCREEAGETAGGHRAPGDVMETPVTGVLAFFWSCISSREREGKRKKERERERGRELEPACSLTAWKKS